MKRAIMALLFVALVTPAAFAAETADDERPRAGPAPLYFSKVYEDYAEASVALAEVELRIARESNRRVPHVFSEVDLERRAMNLAVANDRLNVARTTSEVGTTVPLFIQQAREKAATTARVYERAREMQQLYGPSVSELVLERHRLAANVARLRLKVWEDPHHLLSLVDRMQWQIDRLSDEVVDLHKQVEMLQWRR